MANVNIPTHLKGVSFGYESSGRSSLIQGVKRNGWLGSTDEEWLEKVARSTADWLDIDCADKMHEAAKQWYELVRGGKLNSLTGNETEKVLARMMALSTGLFEGEGSLDYPPVILNRSQHNIRIMSECGEYCQFMLPNPPSGISVPAVKNVYSNHKIGGLPVSTRLRKIENRHVIEKSMPRIEGVYWVVEREVFDLMDRDDVICVSEPVYSTTTSGKKRLLGHKGFCIK